MEERGGVTGSGYCVITAPQSHPTYDPIPIEAMRMRMKMGMGIEMGDALLCFALPCHVTCAHTRHAGIQRHRHCQGMNGVVHDCKGGKG